MQDNRRRPRLHGRDLHVRLSENLYAALVEWATRSEVALTTGVRILVERGLSREKAGEQEQAPAGELELSTTSQAAIFATLIAAEQALKAIDSFLPSRDVGSLAEAAADAARRRLEQVELSLGEAESVWRR